ncbi:unnamed protein product [Peniophora sp. CBMAI 1063]|nr:unnamed protein product [Peniophora sp. CBMAI 1063]
MSSSRLARPLRAIHSSARASNSHARTLVGPPDPVSNLRPVIYADAPLPSASGSGATHNSNHPYSLSEFPRSALNDADYRWRLRREELDAFNHAFWTDSNKRFEAARVAALDALPADASPETREAVLSDFYRRWVMQEAPRQAAYTRELRVRTVEEIRLSLRARWLKLKQQVGLAPAPSPNNQAF